MTLEIVPFFPLENGILTGKYRNDGPPPAVCRYRIGGGPPDYERS